MVIVYVRFKLSLLFVNLSLSIVFFSYKANFIKFLLGVDINGNLSTNGDCVKELFIVEGKSAASTIQQAMHKPSQNVLAIQGKLINAEKATPAKVLSNQTCQKIFQSLACGINNDCNPNHLNFSRILLLMDPDIDGVHTRVLLLTLFEHYMRPLLDSGLVSIINPPLFRIAASTAPNYQYAWSEQQRIELLNKMTKHDDVEITRFKGVAQFSVTECIQLLLHPDTRKQINIQAHFSPA